MQSIEELEREWRALEAEQLATPLNHPRYSGIQSRVARSWHRWIEAKHGREAAYGKKTDAQIEHYESGRSYTCHTDPLDVDKRFNCAGSSGGLLCLRSMLCL